MFLRLETCFLSLPVFIRLKWLLCSWGHVGGARKLSPTAGWKPEARPSEIPQLWQRASRACGRKGRGGPKYPGSFMDSLFQLRAVLLSSAKLPGSVCSWSVYASVTSAGDEHFHISLLPDFLEPLHVFYLSPYQPISSS